MKRETVRCFVLTVGAILACLLGFLGGWKLKGQVRIASIEDLNSFYVVSRGDAAAQVRADVLQALRRFQDGYVRRDPAQLEVFMRGLFPGSDQVLLLGTYSSEWVEGYPSVSRLIRSDWLHWGDVRLRMEDAVVSSQGDVAWVATVGQVGLGKSLQPIRFTAVLTRHKQGWMFRQVQFQSVEHGAKLSELLSPRILLELFRKKVPTTMLSGP